MKSYLNIGIFWHINGSYSHYNINFIKSNLINIQVKKVYFISNKTTFKRFLKQFYLKILCKNSYSSSFFIKDSLRFNKKEEDVFLHRKNFEKQYLKRKFSFKIISYFNEYLWEELTWSKQ